MGPVVLVVSVVVSAEALVSVVAGLAWEEVEALAVVSPVVALASKESAVSAAVVAALEAAAAMASG